MKYLIIISIAFYCSLQACSAQKLADFQIKKIEKRDLFIQETSDSLNEYKSKDCILPSFFMNSDYDRSVGYRYWLSNHATISLRKLIIDHIDNLELLLCVLNSEDEKLRIKTPIPENASFTYNKIPYQEYSTYDLVKLRMEEIQNIKRLGKIKK